MALLMGYLRWERLNEERRGRRSNANILARCQYIGKEFSKNGLGGSTDSEFLHTGFKSSPLKAEDLCRTILSADDPASGLKS